LKSSFHVEVPTRVDRAEFKKPFSLTVQEMKKVYTRLCEHKAGASNFGAWAATQEPTAGVPKVAVCFWHTIGDEAATTQSAPDNCVAGVRSAMKNGGFDRVVVLAYRPIENLPPGVVTVDAEKYFPRQLFVERLAAGVPVQIMSDYVRLRFILVHGGWMVDMDTVWLQPVPSLHLGGVSHGHFFASIPAHSRMGASKSKNAAHWCVDFLVKPYDMLYLATPWAFLPGSPVIEQYMQWAQSALIEQEFTAHKTRTVHDYCRGMNALATAINNTGLSASIVASEVCAPIPTRKGASSTKASTAHTFDMGFLKTSMCVNNYWASSRDVWVKQKGDAHSLGLGCRVEGGSAWHQVLSKAFDVEDRRRRKRSFAVATNALRSFSDKAPRKGAEGGAPLREAVGGRLPSASGVGAIAASGALRPPAAAVPPTPAEALPPGEDARGGPSVGIAVGGGVVAGQAVAGEGAAGEESPGKEETVFCFPIGLPPSRPNNPIDSSFSADPTWPGPAQLTPFHIFSSLRSRRSRLPSCRPVTPLSRRSLAPLSVGVRPTLLLAFLGRPGRRLS